MRVKVFSKCYFKVYLILSCSLLCISPLSVLAVTSKTTAIASDGAVPSQSDSTEASLQKDALNHLLDAAVSDLKRHIDHSAPFLTEERQQRIERLEKLPNNSDREMAEKYRRLLEAYRIELDYGKNIEAYQAVLHTGNSDRLVDFLRIGQLALYYQTFDKRESGIWSPADARWSVLPDEYNALIKTGLGIARKLEPPQLMVLPLFGPGNMESIGKPIESMPTVDRTVADKALMSYGGLLSGVRENSASLKAFIRQQPPGPDFARESALLDRLGDSEHTATLNELGQLLFDLNRRLHNQRLVSYFKAQVYAPNGLAIEQDVMSIGGFCLLADGLYLNHSEDDGRLVVLPRQPANDMLALAKAYAQTGVDSLTALAIDPSGGQILQLLVQVPNLKERIQQGGAVGYLILLLGLLAYLLGGYRFIQLSLIGKKIQQQLQTQQLKPDNPLGRILSRLEESKLNDEEALYLMVEEALTTEQTRLEKSLAFLKLVAAISPMLGLLGTVTGMIETFQSIALHGSGDPKLMSGGISQALVTTVEGLVIAIPILLLHSLLTGKSQALAAILEAHTSLALAQRLERRNELMDASSD